MISKLILLAVVIALGVADKVCGPNEHFTACDNVCQKTCDTPNNIACAAVCRPGCICDKGLVRHPISKKCIDPKFCPKKLTCEEFEVKDKCPSLCEKRCNIPNNKQCSSGPCIEKCVCKVGYIRETVGNKCIPEGQCKRPICAKKHQVWQSCGTACEPTCKTWNQPIACTLQCKPGCRCVHGTVRNNLNQCVPINECSHAPKCGQNEVLKSAGANCATCANYKFVKCSLQNKIACYCKDGYVRDKRQVCILPIYCPEIKK